MNDGRAVDDAQGLLAVHILAVLGVGLAGLPGGLVLTEVQESLGRVGLHEVGRAEGLAVGADGGAEELVVHRRDYGHVAAAVGIGEVAVIVGVERVVAVDESGGDQRGLVQVVGIDRSVHRPGAHGVAGHADTGGVDKGHAAEREDALIDAVRREDEEVGRDLGIAVVGLVDGQHDEASAGELNVVSVSHLLIVQIAVTGDDCGSGIVLCGRLGDEQIGGHGVAAVGFDVQFLHNDVAAGGLNGTDHDAAKQHQREGNAQEQFRGFLDFFHGSLSSQKNS